MHRLAALLKVKLPPIVKEKHPFVYTQADKRRETVRRGAMGRVQPALRWNKPEEEQTNEHPDN